MSDDINTWKLRYNDGDAVAQVQNFRADIEGRKIVSKALDGSVYIQTIGSGTKYAEVKILATRTEMAEVDVFESEGTLISVEYRGIKYYGFIEDTVSWSDVLPGEWYTGSFKLLIEEEVSV